MGKQKTSESSSFSGSGQAWAKPYAQRGAGSVQNVFDQNQPAIQRLAGIAQNSLIPQLQGKFSGGAAGAEQARGHYQGILSRGPGQNPHLDSIIGQTRGNVMDSVNNNFSLAGRYGSGGHTGVMTKELADSENALRYQDYNAQMGQQDAAAQALTGANQGETAQLLASLGVGAELPFAGTNSLAQALGALFSGGNSKSTTYGPNPIWGAVGAGLGAAGAAFGKPSERRLKKNIVKVGELKDGLPVYDFIYKNDPSNTVQRGVMVDEVEKLRPWALGPKINGIQTVNYAHIEQLKEAA